MHDKVKEFLVRKQNEEKEKHEKIKKETLLKLGLFEKEYVENIDTYDGEISTEYDAVNAINKYYKKIPYSVTDEEYEEIKKYSKRVIDREENIIAKSLSIIAWIIFIGGFIAGIALGNVEVVKGIYYTYTDTEFSFALALTYWSISLISGMSFLGFAEIIKLLDDIKNK